QRLEPSAKLGMMLVVRPDRRYQYQRPKGHRRPPPNGKYGPMSPRQLHAKAPKCGQHATNIYQDWMLLSVKVHERAEKLWIIGRPSTERFPRWNRSWRTTSGPKILVIFYPRP